MTNNIREIKPLLSFDSEDEFYFIQILKRRKDNPGMSKDCKIIKNYYVRSIEYLDSKMDEIIFLCNHFNARATIRLNKRSYKKAALHMIAELAKSVAHENYRVASGLFDSAAGHARTGDKLWIVDVDTDMLDHGHLVIDSIESIEPMCDVKCVLTLPSKTGVHIISKPFNLQRFKELWPTVDVQKDNPTNLYIP